MESPIGYEDLAPAQKACVVSKVHEATSRYFAHWEDSALREEELDGAIASLLESTLRSRSRWDFTLLVTEFVARLNNPHTRFLDELLYSRSDIGFELLRLEDEWVVVRTTRSDIARGDRLLSIDGVLTAEWFQRLGRYNAGGAHAREVGFNDLLRCLLSDRVVATLEDRRGHEYTVTIDRSVHPPAAHAHRLEHRWLRPGTTAYLRVPTFREPELTREATQLISAYADASGLVVDVRGNGGGSTPTGLVASLMDRPFRYWKEKTAVRFGLRSALADIDAVGPALGITEPSWGSRLLTPPPEGYKGRLAILADRRTMSAAEDFIVPFRINHRALIVGERTAGSTGQPYFHRFPWGMLLSVGTIRAYLPDGTPFEGVGIEPDFHVQVSRRDLYDGRDPTLEAAIEAIAGRSPEHG